MVPSEATIALQRLEGTDTMTISAPALPCPVRSVQDPSPQKAGSTKAMNHKYRGIMNRPLTAAVVRAQEEFKLFCVNPEEVDHNLYGQFLGILKDAGIPWRARKLPDTAEDAMHIMNAVVLAINAYQHYQRDVQQAYNEIEVAIAQTRKQTTNQEIDTTKLTNEINSLAKRFAAAQREHAKETALLKEQVSALKSKLGQSERDLNNANILCAPALACVSVRKLEVGLQEEKKQTITLTSKLVAAERPTKYRSPVHGRVRTQVSTSNEMTNMREVAVEGPVVSAMSASEVLQDARASPQSSSKNLVIVNEEEPQCAMAASECDNQVNIGSSPPTDQRRDHSVVPPAQNSTGTTLGSPQPGSSSIQRWPAKKASLKRLWVHLMRGKTRSKRSP